MAVVALDLNRTYMFTCPSDPDYGKPGATRWKLGTLDSNLMGHIQDQLTQFEPTKTGNSATARFDLNGAAITAAAFALRKGWENFKDDKGHDIIFETENVDIGGRTYPKVAGKVMARIPLIYINEIYAEARDSNQLSDEEAKNSDGGSSPSNSSPSETAEIAPTTKSESGAAPANP